MKFIKVFHPSTARLDNTINANEPSIGLQIVAFKHVFPLFVPFILNSMKNMVIN